MSSRRSALPAYPSAVALVSALSVLGACGGDDTAHRADDGKSPFGSLVPGKGAEKGGGPWTSPCSVESRCFGSVL